MSACAGPVAPDPQPPAASVARDDHYIGLDTLEEINARSRRIDDSRGSLPLPAYPVLGAPLPISLLRVQVERPEARGRLATSTAQRIARRHINEVKFCYEQNQLDAVPGRLVVTLSISERGEVTRTTLGESYLDHCIAQAVKRWHFPTSGPAEVSLPFVFTRP